METARIAELLQPFFAGTNEGALLSSAQLAEISMYIDLLLRWNARINLTAVREPEEMVTRHFGESLFAARHLFPAPISGETRLFDIGSGAGFPGLPLKIWAPQLRVTLIESSQKKVAFLREVIRALTLTNINVFPGRAETLSDPADCVMLRAVERFESALPTATRLVAPDGRLALLIGENQIEQASKLAPALAWSEPLPIPLSSNRVLFVGTKVVST